MFYFFLKIIAVTMNFKLWVSFIREMYLLIAMEFTAAITSIHAV